MIYFLWHVWTKTRLLILKISDQKWESIILFLFCCSFLIGAKNSPATLHREVAILKMNRIELLLSYIRKCVDSSAKKSLIDFTFD